MIAYTLIAQTRILNSIAMTSLGTPFQQRDKSGMRLRLAVDNVQKIATPLLMYIALQNMKNN